MRREHWQIYLAEAIWLYLSTLKNKLAGAVSYLSQNIAELEQ